MNFRFWGLSALAVTTLFVSCSSESESSSGTVGGSFGEGGGTIGMTGVGGTDPFPGGGGSGGIGAGGSGGGAPVCPNCVVIAALPHASSPQQVVVDAAHVYWTTLSGLVMQSDKDGTHVVVLAATEAKPTAIAVQAGFVYWGLQNGVTIRRAPVGGGEVIDLGPSDGVVSIAATADAVFFAGPTGLGTLPVGGLPEGQDETTRAAPTALSIAVGAEGVYWAESGAKAVKKTDFALSTATTLVADPVASPGAIAVDATRVYWVLAQPGDAKIVAASNVDGTSPKVLASLGDALPNAIAVDATDVYWGADSVGKTAIDGNTPFEVLTADVGGVGSVAVDATDVYFTVPGEDLVLKVAK